MWGIFLPVIACGINDCVPKRGAMHSVREINGLYATGMEHWLPLYISNISGIVPSMSRFHTLVKIYQQDKYLPRDSVREFIPYGFLNHPHAQSAKEIQIEL